VIAEKLSQNRLGSHVQNAAESVKSSFSYMIRPAFGSEFNKHWNRVMCNFDFNGTSQDHINRQFALA
jgi:hypothetical protein